VVITRGFRDDPHLDLLEEARWRLQVELDEEAWLEETRVVAEVFGGWPTVFQPPWFSDTERGLTWEIRQWREKEDGERVDRARRPASVSEVLDTLPMRFHSWVIDTTEEAVDALEEVDDDLGFGETDPDLDDSAAFLARVSQLRSELEVARSHRKSLQRRSGRFYGDLYLYEYAPDTELYWRLGAMLDGTECLIVREISDVEDEWPRVLIPPDEAIQWRWTALDQPEAGGEYLPPAEAIAKVPREFRGWVVARTFEALQETRYALHRLAAGTLVDPADLAQVGRLAKHAQQLASISPASSAQYPGGPELEEEDVVAATRSPEGRVTVLLARTWSHIQGGHPEMADQLEIVMETIEEPDHREPDIRVGRERFFRKGGPEAWVRVVTEISGPFDKVVTAFPQANRPERKGIA
jgi:hypothetical protein